MASGGGHASSGSDGTPPAPSTASSLAMPVPITPARLGRSPPRPSPLGLTPTSPPAAVLTGTTPPNAATPRGPGTPRARSRNSSPRPRSRNASPRPRSRPPRPPRRVTFNPDTRFNDTRSTFDDSSVDGSSVTDSSAGEESPPDEGEGEFLSDDDYGDEYIGEDDQYLSLGSQENQALLGGGATSVKKGTLVGVWANLVTATVGAGILSFPYAFASGGIGVTCLLTLLFGVVNVYSLSLMARLAEPYRHLLRHKTYEELVQIILGPRWYVLTVFFILFNVYGALTGFMIIIGDIGTPVMAMLDVAPQYSFLQSRAFLLLVFAFCIAFPLSLFGDIQSLAWPSFVAVASVVAVVISVIYRGILSIESVGPALGPTDNGFVNASPNMVLALPLCIFALGCQLQIIPVYLEVRVRAERALFPRAVAAATTSCGALYLSTGLIGYLQFGGLTQGDVFLNYASTDVLINTVKLIMALHITLAYPVCMFPGRKAIEFLLSRASNRFDYDSTRPPPFLYTCVQNLLIIGSTVVVAIFLPRVDVAFSFVGSTSAPLTIFILPGVMLMATVRRFHPTFDRRKVVLDEAEPQAARGAVDQFWGTNIPELVAARIKRDSRLAVMMIALGVVVTALGLASSIYSVATSPVSN